MPSNQSTPNRKTQARGNARRELLLNAAVELLADREFDEISMADIAQHADIPTASCYTLFANTNLLFSALTNRYSRQMINAIARELTTEEFDCWRELVDACCDAAVKFFNTNPAYRKIMLSGMAPAVVRYSENRIVATDQANQLLIALTDHFIVPQIDNPLLNLTVMIDLADGIISSGFIREQRISQEIVREAKRAAYGYLSLYLPDYLPLKTSTVKTSE